jgi:hypothetical protein
LPSILPNKKFGFTKHTQICDLPTSESPLPSSKLFGSWGLVLQACNNYFLLESCNALVLFLLNVSFASFVGMRMFIGFVW